MKSLLPGYTRQAADTIFGILARYRNEKLLNTYSLFDSGYKKPFKELPSALQSAVRTNFLKSLVGKEPFETRAEIMRGIGILLRKKDKPVPKSIHPRLKRIRPAHKRYVPPSELEILGMGDPVLGREYAMLYEL